MTRDDAYALAGIAAVLLLLWVKLYAHDRYGNGRN